MMKFNKRILVVQNFSFLCLNIKLLLSVVVFHWFLRTMANICELKLIDVFPGTMTPEPGESDCVDWSRYLWLIINLISCSLQSCPSNRLILIELDNFMKILLIPATSTPTSYCAFYFILFYLFSESFHATMDSWNLISCLILGSSESENVVGSMYIVQYDQREGGKDAIFIIVC